MKDPKVVLWVLAFVCLAVLFAPGRALAQEGGDDGVCCFIKQTGSTPLVGAVIPGTIDLLKNTSISFFGESQVQMSPPTAYVRQQGQVARLATRQRLPRE
jgi:hypothetical protein